MLCSRTRPLTPCLIKFVAFVCLTVAFNAHLHAQQQTINNRDLGIALYKQGDDKGALSALRAAVKDNEKDADVWHHLGLALFRTNQEDEARRALEKAVALGSPDAPLLVKAAYANYHLNRLRDAAKQAYEVYREESLKGRYGEGAFMMNAIYIRVQRLIAANELKTAREKLQRKPDDAAAHLQKAQSLIALTTNDPDVMPTLSRFKFAPPSENERAQTRARRVAQFKEAVSDLEAYLQLKPKAKDRNFVSQQLEAVRYYSNEEDVAITPSGADTSTETSKKAVVKRKAETPYTDQARKNEISGVVLVRAILAADGTVKHPLVILPLPYGLSEKAIETARKTKFEPATKDGRAVSQHVTMNFKFNLY